MSLACELVSVRQVPAVDPRGRSRSSPRFIIAPDYKSSPHRRIEEQVTLHDLPRCLFVASSIVWLISPSATTLIPSLNPFFAFDRNSLASFRVHGEVEVDHMHA